MFHIIIVLIMLPSLSMAQAGCNSVFLTQPPAAGWVTIDSVQDIMPFDGTIVAVAYDSTTSYGYLPATTPAPRFAMVRHEPDVYPREGWYVMDPTSQSEHMILGERDSVPGGPANLRVRRATTAELATVRQNLDLWRWYWFPQAADAIRQLLRL